MITVPPSRPDKWHKRIEWVKYANTLFRYYSRRSNYALRLEQRHGMIASVDPRTRIVRLNPDFATAPAGLARAVRHTPTRMRDAIIQNIKGYLAHEAAHVRYSSEKPQGLLGQIWNSIEDERIERLMVSAHPDLAKVFTHLGDTHLARAWPALRHDPLEGILAWRWAHDHPTLRWQCDDPDTWARVLPHVEAAWMEPDPDRVVQHARAILEELRLPEDAQAPEIMSGPLVTCPDPDPRRRKGQSKGKSKNQKDKQQGDGQANTGGGQGEPADEDRDDSSGGHGQDQGHTRDTQAQGGAASDQSDGDENGDHAGDANGTDAGHDQDGDDQQDQASPGERGDGHDHPDSGNTSGDDDACDAQGEDETAADQRESDGGDPADGSDNERDEDDPGDDPFSSHHDECGVAAGGEGVAYTGDEPEAPQVLPEEPDHVRAREVLRGVEGHARDLAAALSLPDAPNLRVSHESRGRFDYARYASGAQRQFRYRKHPGKKEMPRVTLLHDNSGSIGGHAPNAAQWHAVRATMMLQRACELSRTPLNVIAFNTTHAFIATHLDNAEKARGDIGGITSAGGTALAPALRTALATTHPSRKRHVIVIYCDGQINTDDAEWCKRLAHEHKDTFILPILIGPKTRRAQFEHAFGRALEVRNADELAAKLKGWVSANLHS